MDLRNVSIGSRAIWGCLAGSLLLLLVAAASGQEVPALQPEILVGPAEPLPHGPALSLECLAQMSWPELEQLYRQAQPGPIPTGYARGRAIYCPDSRFSGPRSKMTNLLWHGKLFDPAACTLVNQWCGFRAIKANVGYGPSWFDGQPSIIMDYSDTSRVWEDVRDEVREVAPGLYLGRMYRRRCPEPKFQLFFALELAPTCP